MPPAPFSRADDPDGLYAILGLGSAATQSEIHAAYRTRARVLHPDVPRTGDAAAFLSLKQAYDSLSDPLRRAAYDRRAEQAPESHPNEAYRPDAEHPAEPPGDTDQQHWTEHTEHHYTQGEQATHSAQYYQDVDTYYERETGITAMATWPQRLPRIPNLPIIAWAGLGVLMVVGGFEMIRHLTSPASHQPAPSIRANAPTVAPLSPSAHRAILYGKPPVRFVGTPNIYIAPNSPSTTIWRFDAERKSLVPIDEVPPFSTLQAVRVIRQSGMVEVVVNAGGQHGFVASDQIIAGDQLAARRAYCSYNAGTAPVDGEVLDKRNSGDGTLVLENQAPQPAVVKLRDAAGSVAASVYVAPGSHVELTGLPDGTYRPDLAFGELWSRACNSFTAGMRAMRLTESVRFPGQIQLTLTPDADQPARTEIDDQTFETD